MTLLEKLQQIERVDALIRRKSTGSPRDLAKRLDASERCTYDLIKIMKQMGAPIYFCSQRNSYCYEEDVVFSIGFIPKQAAQRQVVGGKTYFFFSLQNFCSETP